MPITIQGVSFECKAPYVAGHPLTANEAAALNRTRAENVGNGVREMIKEAIKTAGVEDADQLPSDVLDEIRAKFAEFDETYEFGVTRGRETDPVKVEARSIANTEIRTALINKGFAPKDITADVLAEYRQKLEPTYGERWTKAAEKVVRERSKGSTGVNLDLAA